MKQDVGVDGIVALAHDESVVRRVIDVVNAIEYKPRQVPPGVRIMPRALGKDCRLSAVSSRWWSNSDGSRSPLGDE